MPTGDVKNNLRKLQTEVKLMKYPETLDIKNLTIGDAKAFMPIYHYAFTSFSPSFAEEVTAKEVLFAKSDSGFMDSVYRILRDMFSYRPLVNKDQFFSNQFAERKIIMCTEVLQLIQRKCRLQPASKTNFRLNSSMDNIAKPPTGKPRPRSAVTENKENKDMPPPMSGPKRTNLNRSTSSVPRIESNKYRLPSARSSIPKQTKPHNVKDLLGAKSDGAGAKPQIVKEILNLNHSVDSALAFSFTPSIARVKPQSVEVINLPRTQAGGSSSSMLGGTEGGSGVGAAASVDVAALMGEKIENLVSLLKNVETRLTVIEEKIPLMEVRPEPKLSTPKRPVEESAHLTNVEARLKLLENRMLILESKLSEGEVSPVCSKSGKVTTPGKQGTFMVVESFVNGESKVRKMAREAEAKIRSRSTEEEGEKPSPIRRSPVVEAKTMDEEMFTMIPDPEPCNSSTPTKPPTLEDVSLKCVDTPTQDQANRIQHLVESTKSLLKPAQTELTADEEKRHDVD